MVSTIVQPVALKVSKRGNGFSQSLIDTLPSLWTEEQQSTLANAGGECHGSHVPMSQLFVEPLFYMNLNTVSRMADTQTHTCYMGYTEVYTKNSIGRYIYHFLFWNNLKRNDSLYVYLQCQSMKELINQSMTQSMNQQINQ